MANIYLHLQEKNNCFTKTQGLYQWSTVFSTGRQSLLNRVSLKTFICAYRKKKVLFYKNAGSLSMVNCFQYRQAKPFDQNFFKNKKHFLLGD